jgi:hypothetical protein
MDLDERRQNSFTEGEGLLVGRVDSGIALYNMENGKWLARLVAL